MFRKIPIVAILAIVIGVAVTGYSYYKSGGLAKPAQAYVAIPVPSTEISSYTTITRNDIVLKEYMPGTEPQGIIMEPEGLIGKVAIKNLHKDMPITPNEISDLTSLPNLEVVSVNVDAARAAGAQQGDIVDVYWIKTDQTGQATATPVASNARVVEICDANGNPTSATQSSTMAPVANAFKTTNGASIIYRLLIKPEEVSGVVAGGAPKNTSVALVKKFNETTTVIPAVKPTTTNPTVKGATK
jgi:hypothetical protein